MLRKKRLDSRLRISRLCIGLAVALAAGSSVADGKRPSLAAMRHPKYAKVLDIEHQLKWLNADDLILSRTFDEPVWIGPDEFLAHANLADGFLIEEYRVNLRTGKATGFDKMRPKIDSCRPAHWALSSDRQWMLWLQGHPNGPDCKIMASRVDGIQTVRWPAGEINDGRTLVWIPGGHRFAFFHWKEQQRKWRFDRAFVYDRDKPQQPPRQVVIPSTISASLVLGFLPNSRVVVTDDPSVMSPHTREATLISFSLDNAAGTLKRNTVRWPNRNQRLNRISLSSNGQSIAWEFDGPSSLTRTLWVSRADGTDIRRIGTIPGEVRGWYPDGGAVLVEKRDEDRQAQVDEVYRVPIR